MLWGLLLLPAFVGWYLLGVRRIRHRAAGRFADEPFFAQLAVRLPKLWRHVSMGLYFLALALLIAAVSLLIDTSGSMAAPDVQPSRLEAAKAAGRAFLDVFPQGPKVGLVTFSTYATVNVPPTPDHDAVKQGLSALKPQETTAIGDGIALALRNIPGRVVSAPAPNPMAQNPFSPATPAPFVPPGSSDQPRDLPPAAIILLSDGGQNDGAADPVRMALEARRQKVKIYTIGLGTLGGSVFQYQGQMVLVPFDPALLEQIASASDGKFYFSPNRQDLQQIYRDLGRTIGWESRKTEVSSLFVGGAGVLMLGGGLLSLLWMGRLP